MGLASVSYTNKDYDSLRRELIARVPQLTDKWTDLNASDLGVTLLELFCGVADMLTYYIDQQAGEAFLSTARQRKNIIQHCEQLSYRLDTVVSSTTAIQFSIPATLGYDITIPALTVCRADTTSGSVEFETLADAVITAGQLSTTANARQGKRTTQSFVGTGLAYQQVLVTTINLAQGSVSVTVDGAPWSEVTNFMDSASTDLHFRVDTDYLSVTRISFGNGINGVIPASQSAIVISALESVGASGNIGRGTITKVVSTILYDGVPVTLTSFNPIPATGGADRESLAHARVHAPVEFRTLQRAVTKSDYQALVEGYPGVAKAQVVDAVDCPEMRYLAVNIVAIPNGGGNLSPTLKSELNHFLDSRKMVTQTVTLYDPKFITVPISATVLTTKDITTSAQRYVIANKISVALSKLFALENLDFGKDIFTSDIIATIDNTSGVDHCTLVSPSSDVTIGIGEIAVLGPTTITVN